MYKARKLLSLLSFPFLIGQTRFQEIPMKLQLSSRDWTVSCSFGPFLFVASSTHIKCFEQIRNSLIERSFCDILELRPACKPTLNSINKNQVRITCMQVVPGVSFDKKPIIVLTTSHGYCLLVSGDLKRCYGSILEDHPSSLNCVKFRRNVTIKSNSLMRDHLHHFVCGSDDGSCLLISVRALFVEPEKLSLLDPSMSSSAVSEIVQHDRLKVGGLLFDTLTNDMLENVVITESIHSFSASNKSISCLSAAEDGSVLIGTLDGALRMWSEQHSHDNNTRDSDLRTILKPSGEQIFCLDVLSDGMVAVGFKSGRIGLLNFKKKEKMKLGCASHTGGVTSIKKLDRNHFLSIGWDACVRIWEDSDLKKEVTLISQVHFQNVLTDALVMYDFSNHNDADLFNNQHLDLFGILICSNKGDGVCLTINFDMAAKFCSVVDPWDVTALRRHRLQLHSKGTLHAAKMKPTATLRSGVRFESFSPVESVESGQLPSSNNPRRLSQTENSIQKENRFRKTAPAGFFNIPQTTLPALPSANTVSRLPSTIKPNLRDALSSTAARISTKQMSETKVLSIFEDAKPKGNFSDPSFSSSQMNFYKARQRMMKVQSGQCGLVGGGATLAAFTGAGQRTMNSHRQRETRTNAALRTNFANGNLSLPPIVN
eukprot:GDKJ01029379.1.p1 GENE.GDKJ01029379.1~~GDKJ01029379.1.p1  ORF type:complete len:727 (+),score=111.04 GDKJ01029379.1:219-2183(+)